MKIQKPKQAKTNPQTRKRLIDPGFRDFLGSASPNYQWDPTHLRECRKWLNKVSSGDCKRLMLFLPPRHGKSEQATIHYPAYRLLRDQTKRVIVGAYNHGLACTFSRQTRRIVTRFGFKFATDLNKQNQWGSVHGGGLYAVGVGSGVAGYGADLVVIDDPVKSRAEAESPTYRNRLIDWYQNDIYTRLHPGAPIVLIMTRWHSLDLAGQLLEQARDGGESWDVVTLPAIAEDHDTIGRQPGEALWPERYGIEDFDRIKKAVGSYAFSALYQQTPKPRDGGFFRHEWFNIVERKPREGLACRGWDTAATPGSGDYTAGIRIVREGDRYIVTDAWRGQVSPNERRVHQRRIAEMDGHQTIQHLAQDPGSAGVDQVENDVRNLIGYPVESQRPTGSKEVRAMPFAAACEAGLVDIERGEWNRDFLDELCGFPTGKHDDQVDAASDAFNLLSRTQAFEWFT
jgi:predicted phage terminase large subunit-like protein